MSNENEEVEASAKRRRIPREDRDREERERRRRRTGGGAQGPQGPQGPTGSIGTQGAIGTQGPQGPTGLATGGSIIPFASGAPVAPTTLAGLATTGGLVGFGSSLPSVTIVGDTFTLDSDLLDFAFVAPRAGTITSLAAFFSVTLGVTLVGTVTPHFQIWSSPIGSNTFTPLAGAVVDLPSLAGIVLSGDNVNAINDTLSIPITPELKLLLVVSITSDGTVATLAGFASAGMTIE